MIHDFKEVDAPLRYRRLSLETLSHPTGFTLDQLELAELRSGFCRLCDLAALEVQKKRLDLDDVEFERRLRCTARESNAEVVAEPLSDQDRLTRKICDALGLSPERAASVTVEALVVEILRDECPIV